MKTPLYKIKKNGRGDLARRGAQAWLFVLTAILATGCNSVYMNFDYDDVYGNAPSRREEARLIAQTQRQNRPNGQNTSDQANAPQLYYDENTGIYYTYNEATGEYTPYEADTNAYEYPEFDYDKYYDYEYSSRLKRFHQDDYLTDNYYDDYYTNTYWYDHNPYSYGTSIYLGFNNWMPSFTVWGGGWSLGLSYGYDPFWYRSCRYWPYYSYWDWGWPGYWGPGYGWGWGHGYGHGYWHGYWDGYHDGFWGSHWADNDYFYNSFDKNTYYKQEIRRGHSGGGSGSAGAGSQPLIVRRGDGTAAGGGSGSVTTGGASGSLTDANSGIRRGGSATGGNAAGGGATGGASSNIRRNSSFAERYQAAVNQERVSVDKDGNVRDNGGISTNPVRPTQRPSNTQPVRTTVGVSGAVRMDATHTGTNVQTGGVRDNSGVRDNGNVSTNPVRPTQRPANLQPVRQVNGTPVRANVSTAPQRTTTPSAPQRTVNPSNQQRTTNPSAPQRTTRPNAYTAPSYNSGSRNSGSYYSPQYQRQTTPNYNRPTATPARQTPAVRSTTTTPSRATYSTGGSSGGSRSSGGSSGGNSGGSTTRRR